MPATLFFDLLTTGRMVAHRRQFRTMYELCRVALFPHMKPEHREEAVQYYWDGSITENEKFRRDEIIERVNEDAKKTTSNPDLLTAIRRLNR